MGSRLTFQTVDAFERGYAGEDTIFHEKAALARSGAQDDFCMICNQKNKPLFPELSPGEIHYCPRKWCSDCVEVPREWFYQSKPKIKPSALERYSYYIATCWICEKRGWDYISPLMGPSNPEWNYRDGPSHIALAKLRYEEWRDADVEDGMEELPRFKFQKLLDKFSADPSQQLQNDRQLFQAMKLDILKVPFAPLFPGGRSATQSSSKPQPRRKSLGRPRKYQEQASFDTTKAFEGACRWLQDLQDQDIDDQPRRGRIQRTHPTEDTIRRRGEDKGDDDYESDGSEDSQDRNDPPYHPRSTRSSCHWLRRRDRSASATRFRSNSQGKRQIDDKNTTQEQPTTLPDPQPSIDQMLADIDDAHAVKFCFKDDKVIVLKNDWKTTCMELASQALKTQTIILEATRKITYINTEKKALEEILERNEKDLCEERNKATQLMARAGLAESEMNRRSEVAAAAEANAIQLQERLEELQTQYSILQTSHSVQKRDNTNAMSECSKLRNKIVELEETRDALTEERNNLRSEGRAREIDREAESRIANEKSRQLLCEFEDLKRRTAEFENQDTNLKSQAAQLMFQNVELQIQAEEFKKQSTKLQKQNAELTTQVQDLLRDAKRADLTTKRLRTMFSGCLDRNKLRKQMLQEERQEGEILRQQIVELEATVSILRADCAAFGFEFGCALKISEANKTELPGQLAVGCVTTAAVDRLMGSSEFNNSSSSVNARSASFRAS